MRRRGRRSRGGRRAARRVRLESRVCVRTTSVRARAHSCTNDRAPDEASRESRLFIESLRTHRVESSCCASSSLTCPNHERILIIDSVRRRAPTSAESRTDALAASLYSAYRGTCRATIVARRFDGKAAETRSADVIRFRWRARFSAVSACSTDSNAEECVCVPKGHARTRTLTSHTHTYARARASTRRSLLFSVALMLAFVCRVRDREM